MKSPQDISKKIQKTTNQSFKEWFSFITKIDMEYRRKRFESMIKHGNIWKGEPMSVPKIKKTLK